MERSIRPAYRSVRDADGIGALNLRCAVTQHAPKYSDGVALLEIGLLRVEVAHQVGDVVAVDVFTVRVAVCQARLVASVAKRQRSHVNLRGRVKRRARKNGHANLSVALRINGSRMVAIVVA